MALNINALKAAQQQLDSKGGSEGFMGTKDLTPEGVVIRLLPPPPQLNGMIHFMVTKYWMTVNGKRMPVICPSTFGKKSVIEEELEEARQSDDQDIVDLASDVDVKTGVIRQEEAWMAVLRLEYNLGKNQQINGVKVVDDCAKIFQCSKNTLTSSIIGIVTGPRAARLTKDAEDGICDREAGCNIMLSKTGQKLATKYAAALDEQMEMDAKYYRNVPNVYETAKAQMHLPSYQRALIRQYLYGEDIPADVQAKETARAEAAKEAFKQSKAKDADEEPKKKSKKPVDDEDEEAATKPKKKAVVDDEDDEPQPTKKSAKKKPADDEDEDEPTPGKKSAKKAAVDFDEDEDDYAPTPLVKKGKTPTPPAKATAVKGKAKSILDDLNLDEDEMPF